MMYRRNKATTPRAALMGAIAKLSKMGADGYKAILDSLMRVGLYQEAERENRQRTRRAYRNALHSAYPYCGVRHRDRLARQIAAGQKTAANGVVEYDGPEGQFNLYHQHLGPAWRASSH